VCVCVCVCDVVGGCEVVEKAAQGQVHPLPEYFVLPCLHKSIIPPVLHTDLHSNAIAVRRTSGQRLGNFTGILCFADRASWYDWVNDQLDAQLRYIIRLLL